MSKQPTLKKRRGMMGKVLIHRKTIAVVGLLGGLLVFKIIGDEEPSKPPEAEKTALAEQAPAADQPQQKTRRSSMAALSQKPEPEREIQVPDEVGFGGPDPEAEKNPGDEVSPDKEMKTAIFFFESLPFDELRQTIQEIGFDEIFEINDYLDEVDDLRDAIKYGNQADIRQAASDVLREGSLLMNKKSNSHKRYIKVRRKIIKTQGKEGRKKLKYIKQILIATYQYAQLLASR